MKNKVALLFTLFLTACAVPTRIDAAESTLSYDDATLSMPHTISKNKTFEIMFGIKKDYEKYHNVNIDDKVLEYLINQSDKYIINKYRPDKCIDILDDLLSTARINNKDEVSIEDVDNSINYYLGNRINKEIKDLYYKELEKYHWLYNNHLLESKPLLKIRYDGNEYGLEYLLSDLKHIFNIGEEAVLLIDLEGYKESYMLSSLVGAPPGYIAHEEGGKLTEAVRRKPYSIVLFDEIEKAHADIFNILLQGMDEGRLTDRQGRVVDFRNTIIIMTSNVGTRQLNEFGTGIGFNADNINAQQTEHMLTKALNRTFPPEFVNRLDNVVVFHPLNDEALAQILTLELHPLQQRLEAMGYQLRLTKKTQDQLLERSRDRKYGARPLKRAIQTLVEDPITDMLLSGNIENNILKL